VLELENADLLPGRKRKAGGALSPRDTGDPDLGSTRTTLAGPSVAFPSESNPPEPRPEIHPESARIASLVAAEEQPLLSGGSRGGSLSPSSMLASVIVCTHNGSRVIAETLESLVRQDVPPEVFEILVVDNASTDATPEVVGKIAARHPGRIRLIREQVLGHSRARNRGVQESCGDVIAFTDDDARVSPRWLRALVEACERPQVGCAGGPVRAVLEGPLPAWVTGPFLLYLALFDKGGKEVELSYNEYPRGVNMAFPRQSFREVGLFSTAFGLKGRSLLYYDEIELCYRLERLGRRILYTPDAEVEHAIHPERLTAAWFK
jgi:glucosyl-dolichyl phosphate glucuronosyltransferase